MSTAAATVTTAITIAAHKIIAALDAAAIAAASMSLGAPDWQPTRPQYRHCHGLRCLPRQRRHSFTRHFVASCIAMLRNNTSHSTVWIFDDHRYLSDSICFDAFRDRMPHRLSHHNIFRDTSD